MAGREEVVKALKDLGYTEGQAVSAWAQIMARAGDDVSVGEAITIADEFNQTISQGILTQVTNGSLSAEDAIRQGVPKPVAERAAAGVSDFGTQAVNEEATGETTSTGEERQAAATEAVRDATESGVVLSDEGVEKFKNELGDAVELSLSGTNLLTPDREFIDEWLNRGSNQEKIRRWMATGRPVSNFANETTIGVQEDGLAELTVLLTQGGSDAVPEFTRQELARKFGLDPEVIAGHVSTVAREEQLYADPDLQAEAAARGFIGDDGVKRYLKSVRDIMGDSSDEGVRQMSTTFNDSVLMAWLDNNNVQFVADEDERNRLAGLLYQRTGADALGHAYVDTEGQNRFAWDEEWNQVGEIIGEGDQTETMIRNLFSVAAPILGDTVGDNAGYIAGLMKKNGSLEEFLTFEAPLEFQGTFSVTAAMPPGVSQRTREIFAEQGLTDDRVRPGFAPNDPRGTEAPSGAGGGHPLSDPRFAGPPSASSSGLDIFRREAEKFTRQWDSALAKYGRPELAIIAIDDPGLAATLFNNGSPSDEGERQKVLEIYEDNQDFLGSMGIGKGFSERFVNELTTIGGALGASRRASGADVVNHQDPLAVAEIYRTAYQDLLLGDPADADVSAFVNSIRGQETAAQSNINTQISAQNNLFRGIFATEDTVNQILHRNGVAPGAQAQADLRNTTQYRALYRHRPRGQSEQDFQAGFRNKVGELVGFDDLGQNLDSVRQGMIQGSGQAALQRAFVRNAATDETVRGRIASNINFLRGQV